MGVGHHSLPPHDCNIEHEVARLNVAVPIMKRTANHGWTPPALQQRALYRIPDAAAIGEASGAESGAIPIDSRLDV